MVSKLKSHKIQILCLLLLIALLFIGIPFPIHRETKGIKLSGEKREAKSEVLQVCLKGIYWLRIFGYDTFDGSLSFTSEPMSLT